MATPFDLPQARPATDSVTERQLLNAVKPMLADRDWRSGPDTWATRCAAIKTVLNMVTDPAALESAAANGHVVTGNVVTDFNAFMATLASTAQPGEEFIWKPLTKQGASKLIDWLGSQQWANRYVSSVEEANVAKAKAAVDADNAAEAALADSDSPEGFWSLRNAAGTVEIYKVQIAVHGSGHPYAKKLNTETGKFEMASGMYRVLLRSGHKLTLEEATEFGHLYGICGRCGRTLTDDDSIAAGIGPICASKF